MKSVKKIYKILKTNSSITLKNLPGHVVCLLQKRLNFNEDKVFNLLFFHFYITRVLRTCGFVGNRAEERNTQVATLVGITGSYPSQLSSSTNLLVLRGMIHSSFICPDSKLPSILRSHQTGSRTDTELLLSRIVNFYCL